MNITSTSAAHALVGRNLNNNWFVEKLIESNPSSTGGFFSVCYLVNNGERQAFLKALNFAAFFQIFQGRPVVEIIAEQTKAYQFEREIMMKCKNRKLTKVSIIIDEGEEFVDGFTIPKVPYLIFEIADGDVRAHMNFSDDIDIAWKLRSLHDVAVGLKQLHGIGISHQDIKPSNILLFQNGIVSKISDLGRSLCSDLVAPHDDGNSFTGDFSYAPPEFLYRHVEPDWNKRVRSTDMYLFGSLISFYFLGINMTALIGKNLDPQFRWTNWGGGFLDVKDYLTDAFYRSLRELKSSISNTSLANDIASLVEKCCFPYPDLRGFSSISDIHYIRYDFHRIISKLDLLSKKAEFNFYN